MGQKINRRQFPRRATDLAIDFAIEYAARREDQGRRSGTLLDLSSGGMQFVAPGLLWPGARIRFRLTSGIEHESVLEGLAVVVHAEQEGKLTRARTKFLEVARDEAA